MEGDEQVNVFKALSLPKFLSAFVHPDSSFSRVTGAPREIEDLYLEWCRCSGDWDWVCSPRGRYVDERLDAYERVQGR